MPRNQKIIERVFADIIPSDTKFGQYDTLLSIKDENTDILSEMKDLYKSMISDNFNVLSNLAKVEEIIIQLRCKEAIDTELRLSLSRNYIYARSLFYRRGRAINDIRVIIGKTSEFREGIDVLINDIDFRTICKAVLLNAMEKEITANISNLKLLYTNANQ